VTPRTWAILVLAVLVVTIGVLAAVLIPWHETPAPRADQLAALQSLPRDQVERGRAFTAALRPGTYGSLLVGLIVALIIGLTPVGAHIVSWAGKPFGGNWAARALLGGLLILVISTLLTLPFSARQHVVMRRYGLSTQGWGGWFVDVAKGFAVSAVIAGIALLGFYALTRFVPRWWWAWAALGAAAVAILLSFVFPVLVEPVFNKFTPMADGPLRTELIALADRDGVPVRDVLVADASRRTRAVNAYVSGFGATRRIVVYDTLLEQASPDEVVSVVAHELGHAKRNDVLTGTVIGALGAAAAVIAIYLLGSWSWLLRRAGVDDIGDPRALGLIVALATLAGLVAGPAANYVSRHIEARADTHALELTGDPSSFEQMQARLAQLNLSNPDPSRFEYFVFASHPSTAERIAAARAYARGER
jgi:STE24 endopeptidase